MSIFQLLDHKEVVGYYSSLKEVEKAVVAYTKDRYKIDNPKVGSFGILSKSLADIDPKFHFTVSDVLFTVIQIRLNSYYDIGFKRIEV
jgi:hypothetical protein